MISSEKARSGQPVVPIPEQAAEPEPITIPEIEAFAQQKLTKQVWDFYVSGSDDQRSSKRNLATYDKCVFLPATKATAK